MADQIRDHSSDSAAGELSCYVYELSSSLCTGGGANLQRELLQSKVLFTFRASLLSLPSINRVEAASVWRRWRDGVSDNSHHMTVDPT
jgi:hypothetical protein